MDAPRRGLSAGILYAACAADAPSPYNFRPYYDFSSLGPLALLAGNPQLGFNFLLAKRENAV